MSDEKEPLFFVWERRSNDHVKFKYKFVPVLYRGEPKTGMGMDKDNSKYVQKQKLTLEEETETLEALCTKYPCPEVTRTKSPAKPKPVDLTRNVRTRDAKREHLVDQKVSPEEAKKILDELYPPEPTV